MLLCAVSIALDSQFVVNDTITPTDDTVTQINNTITHLKREKRVFKCNNGRKGNFEWPIVVLGLLSPFFLAVGMGGVVFYTAKYS